MSTFINNNRPSGAYEIAQATTDVELELIYKFRYSIYVEEMNRVQFAADHNARRIKDDLDFRGRNLFALYNQVLVGVARVNLCREGDLHFYDDIYEMRSIGAQHPAGTSIVTRFMVSREHRGTGLAIALCAKCYQLGLALDIEWCFMDCNAHLVDFFTRIGWVVHRTGKVHAEYGAITVMRFDLHDTERLRRIESPLHAIAVQHGPRCSSTVQEGIA